MTVQSIVGRATHANGQSAPVSGPSLMNSFCLTCASWFYGHDLSHCEKCGSAIFRWVTNYDMKFFRRGYGTHRIRGRFDNVVTGED